MVEESFSLSRNDFDVSAPTALKELWNDHNFTDVTLATVDNKQTKSHKVILSASSPFFKNILLQNPHQSPLLYLKGIKYQHLQKILEFIYLGRCDVQKCDLEDFLETGKDLRITGIFDSEEPEENTNASEQVNPEQTLKQITNTDVENSPEIVEPEIFNHIAVETCFVESIFESPKEEISKLVETPYLPSEVKPIEPTMVAPTIFQRVINCDECDFTTSKVPVLKKHKKALHSDVKMTCKHCGGKFREENGLKNHPCKPTFMCEVKQCALRFDTMDALHSHTEINHGTN